MDSDLQSLRELGEGLKPPAELPPMALRGRVLHRLAEPPRPRVKPRLWMAAALVGAAAAVALPLVLAGPAFDPGSPTAGAGRDGGADNPARLLELAANRVAAEPERAVRNDQFIYTESVALFHQLPTDGDRSTTVEVLKLVRLWSSVDGSRDGLIQVRAIDAGDAAWVSQTIPACVKADGCGLTPGQATRLPTDADGMHAYLYRSEVDEFSGARLNADERAFNRAGNVLRASQHSPAVQAAVFAAMSRIPGVQVRPGVSNVVGRQGVAVAYSGAGSETQLVFEDGTYRYLGINRQLRWLVVLKSARDHWLEYQLASREAITGVAIVEEVGRT